MPMWDSVGREAMPSKRGRGHKLEGGPHGAVFGGVGEWPELYSVGGICTGALARAGGLSSLEVSLVSQKEIRVE